MTNTIRDAIRPNLTMHTLCEIRQMEDKNVVVVHVQRGTACPYYLTGKGIRPEGVFIRQGAETTKNLGLSLMLT